MPPADLSTKRLITFVAEKTLMSRFRTFALSCAVVALIPNISTAVLFTADPDNFAAGTNISNAYPGIALISVGAGYDGDFDPNIFARNPLNHPEPINASTGQHVFGTNDAQFPASFGGFGGAVLRVDFTVPTNLVRLDAIGNDPSDFARFQAFSAANAVLSTYNTASMATSVFETMTVSSGVNIAYVLASGVSGDSVAFDHLRFEIVPELTTVTLCMLAAIGALFARWRH
jgi:hypothetical protein